MAEHVIVARYQKGSQKFELVIDPEKAMLYRQGKATLADAVRFPQVYIDAKKGEKASGTMLERTFETQDFEKVADAILRHGKIPETAGQRDEKVTQLRARITEMIHRSGVDPKTHAPHPLTRIDAALDEAKVHLDANLSADAQVADVIKQLRPILPLKIELHHYRVMVPVNCVGAALKIIKGTGRLLREDWSGNGDLIAEVEIPGGLSVDFQESIMAATHGKASFTVLRQE